MAAPPTSGGIISVEECHENIPSIECLARFAVNEYNEGQKSLVLEFMCVLESKMKLNNITQFEEHTIIVIAANNIEKKNKVYEAKVHVPVRDEDPEWEYKKLIYIKSVIPN